MGYRIYTAVPHLVRVTFQWESENIWILFEAQITCKLGKLLKIFLGVSGKESTNPTSGFCNNEVRTSPHYQAW